MSDALADLTAVILAGGLGTRLRSIVGDRQKVVAEINGKPLLVYLLEQLADFGVQRAVLCTGYHGQQVQQTLGDFYGGIALNYSQEFVPMGTGGALRMALPLTKSSQILVMNGDSFCTTDLIAFREFHHEARATGSLVLVQVPDTKRFGRVEADSEGKLISFVEKAHTSGPGWINAGIYLLSIELIREISPKKSISLERELFPQWICRGLMGYQSTGQFLDIGTPESYAEAADFFRVKIKPRRSL